MAHHKWTQIFFKFTIVFFFSPVLYQITIAFVCKCFGVHRPTIAGLLPIKWKQRFSWNALEFCNISNQCILFCSLFAYSNNQPSTFQLPKPTALTHKRQFSSHLLTGSLSFSLLQIFPAEQNQQNIYFFWFQISSFSCAIV